MISRKIYYGPLFSCTARLVTKNTKITTCPNEQCPNYKADMRYRFDTERFCSRCGSEISTTFPSTVESVEPDREDLDNAIKEQLYEVTRQDGSFPRCAHLWIPNVKRSFQPREFHIEESGFILSDNRQPEMSWFAMAFPGEYSTLEKFYGEDKVALVWGLLRYSM